MVAQHYRWDFIGLSTDTKPTPATSEKVVNGSTFYCSDESKLYVYCDGTWYERKPLGGGGGSSYTAGSGIDITNDTISVDTQTIQEKLTAGSNITISDNTISATDTTYSAFTGTDGTAAGVAGLVPAPATTDAGKFLKANGTWDAVSGGSIIKLTTADYNWNQSTGTETDPNCVAIWKLPPGIYYIDRNDSVVVCTGKFGALGQEHYIFIVGASYTVNSKEQKPFTILKDNDSGLLHGIAISYLFNVTDLTESSIEYLSNYSIYNSGLRDRVQIGTASSTKNGNVAIGTSASSTGNRSTAVGRQATASATGAIALGSYSSATVAGQLDVGTTNTSDGYNSTNYRLITGVHDGQELNHAATVAQGNTLATSAPDTSTVGVLGQLYTDTTNMHTYQCTAISGSTYTWTQRW